MNIRNTDLYKTMTLYTACAIAEGFADPETYTEEDIPVAWQWLVDTGNCWQLNGWYGRNAVDLIDNGTILPPLETHTDFYGNKVRGTKDRG